MWLTPAGGHVRSTSSTALILAWIVDKLSRSPNFEGRPDRAQVEAALDRIAHRIVAQPDWGDDQSGAGCWPGCHGTDSCPEFGRTITP